MKKKYRLNKTQLFAFLFVVVMAVITVVVFVSIIHTMFVEPERVFTTHPNFIGW